MREAFPRALRSRLPTVGGECPLLSDGPSFATRPSLDLPRPQGRGWRIGMAFSARADAGRSAARAGNRGSLARIQEPEGPAGTLRACKGRPIRASRRRFNHRLRVAKQEGESGSTSGHPSTGARIRLLHSSRRVHPHQLSRGRGREIRVSRHAPEDAGSQTYPATLIGKDELTDVALLKIDSPRKFPVLPLGNTELVDVADWVVVIGNPYGMANSVTVGVVSYKGRTGIAPNGKDGYFDYLQTDASINPGNSGGPMLDLNGTVVAIASAINVSAQGIGFALPIEVAKAVLPQLSTQGSVRRSWMGISVRDHADSEEPESAEGVVVANVLSGGPASEAGLKAGDVILRVGSTAIRRADALRWKVALGQVGKLMDLTVRRRGKPLHFLVKLAETPPEVEDDAYSSQPDDGEDSTLHAVPAEQQVPSHQ